MKNFSRFCRYLRRCSSPVPSSTKKGDSYNEAWVKDTNGFDILMGQFAHNIENLWGFKEVLIAGPKDYVKYTDLGIKPAAISTLMTVR